MDKFHVRAIVLAAGKSARFKTKKSKLLHNICGRSMVLYPLKALEALRIPMTVVLGHQAEDVQRDIVAARVPHVSFVMQHGQEGTGHAVACSRETWDHDTILILYGDTPLVTADLLEELLAKHFREQAAITFCSTMVHEPEGYGRVIVADDKISIVEDRDCSSDQREICLINAGLYVMQRSVLEQHFDALCGNGGAKRELYLVDLIELASKDGLRVVEHRVPFDLVRGVNTLQDLWGVEQIKRSELIKKWMAEGVRFELAQSIHIDLDVTIGAGSFIGTGTHLLGNTHIGQDCFISAFSIIENTTVGDNTMIHSHSVIQDSVIKDHVHVGPFARLRAGVEIGNHTSIGNFVEMKSTTVGEHVKMKHLSYVGDAVIGDNSNIGAGTITCNYDGKQKHKTIIEDHVFVGSNNTLIAPLTLKKGSYTAGGSTITDDVPQESLAIGRAQQVNKVGYVTRFLGKQSDDVSKQQGCSCQRNKPKFSGAVKTHNETSDVL